MQLFRQWRAAEAMAACLLFFAFGDAASASSIRINPILLQVRSGSSATTLTLTNDGSQAALVKAHALVWRQIGGLDLYEKTSDLIVSPTVARIPAGSSQLIRVGPRQRNGSEERAYRLIVEEMPQQAPSGGTVNIALRFNVPLFVSGSHALTPDIQWTASLHNGTGLIRLGAVNLGGSRADIQGLRFLDKNGRGGPLPGRPGVVLAKGSKEWSLNNKWGFSAGDRLTLTVRLGGREHDVQVILQDY